MKGKCSYLIEGKKACGKDGEALRRKDGKLMSVLTVEKGVYVSTAKKFLYLCPEHAYERKFLEDQELVPFVIGE